jgi:NTP pyrophosphatase (non-canonical NTP hydrolase)
MNDEQTTMAALKQAVDAFVAPREWYTYHSPKNLAMSIAIEAAEVMEHFQWYTAQESIERMTDPELRAEVADEVADVLIYCLSLVNVTQIDISEAILAKLARNETRFPADRVRGRLG